MKTPPDGKLYDKIEERVRHIEKVVVEIQTSDRAQAKAVELQADEYERRLEILNNEHSRISMILSQSVTQERFEDYVKNEREARDIALQRADERFQEFVRRYEEKQKFVDSQLTTASALSAQAAKNFTRNIAIVTVVITIVIIVVNVLLATL